MEIFVFQVWTIESEWAKIMGQHVSFSGEGSTNFAQFMLNIPLQRRLSNFFGGILKSEKNAIFIFESKYMFNSIQ